MKAVKDPEKAHPIASAWRPTIRELVSSFVRGDFAPEGIRGLEAIDSRNAERMKRSVEDYGETLAELSDDTWRTSVAQWMGPHWEIVVDLWTLESGRSDLIVSAFVFEDGDEFRIENISIYVP